MISSDACDPLDPSIPPFVLRNRQRKIHFQMKWIHDVVSLALPDCLATALPASPLPDLTAIEATFISNTKITSIHRDFFQDSTPTDVITFDHGEILIGAETIFSQAPLFSHTPSEEAALCIIHGILHLGGWKDEDVKDAERMAYLQNQIFRVAASRAQGK